MNNSDNIDFNFAFKTATIQDPQKRHLIFRSAMVFPKTSSLVASDSKKIPILKMKYVCNLDQQCKISELISSIDKNQDFSAWGITSMLNEIVTDIHKNQLDYKPETFDGFLIARDGHNLLHLERENSKGDGRTGFLEYNSYHQDMVDEAKAERIISAIHANTRCNIC